MTHQSFNDTLRLGGGDMKALWFLRQVNLYLLNSALKKSMSACQEIPCGDLLQSFSFLLFCLLFL